MPEPQSATVKVRMPDGSTWNIPRENLIRARARGAVEMSEQEDKKQKKTPFLWELEGELGKGMGFDVERIQRYGGASQPKQMLEAANQFMKGTANWMERSAKDPVHLADPIVDLVTGIKNADVGVWKALTEDDASLKNIALRLARLTGAVATAIGGAASSDVAKIPGTAGKVIEAPGKGARAILREVLDVSARDVENARKPVEQRAAEVRAEHAEKVSQARAKNRATYEAEEAEKKSEYAKEVSKADKERVEQSKIEGQRTSLEAAQERYSEQIAENLDKAEKMEKLSLDSEWEDFRKRVLGVSKEAPNGTLQSNLTSVGKAVLEAKKTIVKGSDTNIPIFKDLMGRFSEMVDTPEGAVPMEGQMIPTDQLRGYIRELDDKIYGSELPSDVRNAMKHVSEVANREVEAAIKDVHGKTTAAAYRALKDRHADYMQTWRDKSSGSPVPKIRELLRQQIAGRGVPVYREVADILLGKDGEKILAVLGRKRAFGADTSAIAKLRSAAQKLKELPKPKEVARPERPEFSKVAKFEAPKPPDIETFDPEKFVRDTVEGKAKTIERWGVTGALIYGLRDMIFNQKIPWQSMLGIPVIGKVLKRGMTNPKFIKWLTEGATKGGIA